MNMETLLNTIINNLNLSKTVDNPIQGKVTLGEFMPQGINLQIGQKTTLIMNETMQTEIITSEGESIYLPQAEISIDKTGTIKIPVTIEAKITQVQEGEVQLQVQKINNLPPQQYIRQSQNIGNTAGTRPAAVINDISGLSTVALPHINIAETAAPYIAKLPITPQQKAELQIALRQIEIKVNFPDNNPDNHIDTPKNLPPQQQKIPVLTQIENKITTMTEKIQEAFNFASMVPTESQKTVIQTAVKELAENLQEVVGRYIPATVTKNEQNIILSTQLGEISPETPLSLPENLPIELEIVEIIFSEIPEQEQSVPFSESIEKTIEKIKIEKPQLFSKIITHLPSDNEQMLQQMVAFVKAAEKGDVHQWLGEDIVKQLQNQGDQGQQILNELQNVLQQSHKQTMTWRIIEIPYYIENHIDTIRLAIKQYPDEKDTPEDQRWKFGTRFVVDTNFSQLGAFQFDGFSLAKERRFDLVIRTERSIGHDLYANIMQLFKTTLNEVNYAGNIKINLKENFIKVSENNEEDKLLPRDLFI